MRIKWFSLIINDFRVMSNSNEYHDVPWRSQGVRAVLRWTKFDSKRCSEQYANKFYFHTLHCRFETAQVSLGKGLLHGITFKRDISNAELSTVLRPFYFAVHPDLFGRHPEQRVSVTRFITNSTEEFISYWLSDYKWGVAETLKRIFRVVAKPTIIGIVTKVFNILHTGCRI